MEKCAREDEAKEFDLRKNINSENDHRREFHSPVQITELNKFLKLGHGYRSFKPSSIQEFKSTNTW